MNVCFACPSCGYRARHELASPREWQCPQCDQLVPLHFGESDHLLHACVLCGNTELYKKKDFPHWLGLTILTVACLASIIPYWLYHPWITWTILIGSAVMDGMLYLWVGDVVVCYRCDAQYRDLAPNAEHKPFELGIAERYRQERLRREQLQSKNPDANLR
ncbi:MAG TPA: hypothetical protein VKU02_07295 [Gemmataceae bacterium]|nr:hypothetical protein [Gemmataceae bacterium]